jgi:hypothetical protein
MTEIALKLGFHPGGADRATVQGREPTWHFAVAREERANGCAPEALGRLEYRRDALDAYVQMS